MPSISRRLRKATPKRGFASSSIFQKVSISKKFADRSRAQCPHATATFSQSVRERWKRNCAAGRNPTEPQFEAPGSRFIRSERPCSAERFAQTGTARFPACERRSRRLPGRHLRWMDTRECWASTRRRAPKSFRSFGRLRSLRRSRGRRSNCAQAAVRFRVALAHASCPGERSADGSANRCDPCSSQGQNRWQSRLRLGVD